MVAILLLAEISNCKKKIRSNFSMKFRNQIENQVSNNMFLRVSSLWQVPVPSQESEQSCICVSIISMFPLSMVLDFKTVLPEWILLVFHFII